MGTQQSSNRTNKALLSTVTGVVGYLITYIVAFAYRTVFIHSLGKVYLGVEGLFSNILAMLSLAELGVGTAITFSLYKPLAERDEEKIKSLMAYFKKFYIGIACFIAAAGLALTPFIGFFIKDPPDIQEPLWLVYILYLASTVASYSIVYKQTLINADQKVYVVSVVQNLTTILRSIFQIVWLLTVGTFIPVLIIQIAMQLFSNIALTVKANQLYPFLKSKDVQPLDKEIKSSISEKIKSLFLYKIGAYVVAGTDNILISKFIGIVLVGMYSNYNTLITMAKTFANFFIKAVTPGVGNLTATRSPDEGQRVFHELNFLVFYVFSLVTIEFAILLNPFISLWIGKDYLLDSWTIAFLLINFYLYGLHQNQLIFRNVLGLYVYCRWKPVAEALINIVASLVFIHFFGLPGVFLGTVTSFMTTAFWVEPYVLYKYYFKHGIKKYCVDYALYALFTIIVTALLKYVSQFVGVESWFGFIAAGLSIVVIHLILVIVIFGRKNEFRSALKRIKGILNSLSRKGKMIKQ